MNTLKLQILGTLGAEVDETLTQEGKAADAKSTGEAIAQKTQVQIITWEEDD